MGKNRIATGTANDNIVTATSHNFVVTAELDICRSRNILLMDLSLDLDARNARQILAVHVPFLDTIFNNNYDTIASDFLFNIEHNIVRPSEFSTHSIIHGLDNLLPLIVENFNTKDITIIIELCGNTSILKITREISSGRIIYIEGLLTDTVNIERDKSNTLFFPRMSIRNIHIDGYLIAIKMLLETINSHFHDILLLVIVRRSHNTRRHQSAVSRIIPEPMVIILSIDAIVRRSLTMFFTTSIGYAHRTCTRSIIEADNFLVIVAVSTSKAT